jgi:sulfhydrogenase subunit beta (sulfur reductase)
MKNGIFLLNHEDLLCGIDKIRQSSKVAALVNKNDRFIYDYIDNSKEIIFDYQPTCLSPKKFFFPPKETILEFSSDGKAKCKISAEPLVLFGIRPCDLNGIKILDEAFAEGKGDPNYLAKREQAIIIGLDCVKICDENAFCYRVKAEEAINGFDVMLFAMNKKYVVKTATEKGYSLIKDNFVTTLGTQDDLNKFAAAKQAAFKDLTPFKNLENFPKFFAQSNNHSVWQEEGSRCLSCGSCIMVCPTCYCFDVVDEFKLNLQQGERLRHWDACMLSSFAVVAGGENFRHKVTARLQHRINRKFNFLMKKHGRSVCVGCGRCVRACLAKISPKTIAEKIINDK